jgi:hypothetical protein
MANPIDPESAQTLPLPGELRALIEAGVWPPAAFGCTYVIPTALVRKIAPDESDIEPIAPPFETVASEMARNRVFWEEHGALDEIDPARALMICNFELGSDSVVVLDYRQPVDPPVLRLKWSDNGETHWVECARNFADFAAKLELSPDSPRYEDRVAARRAEWKRRDRRAQRRRRAREVLGWCAAGALAFGVAVMAWLLWPK